MGNESKDAYHPDSKPCTADYKSLQAEQWKTTIDLLCLNREGHAEAGKIIRFICGKSIAVFYGSACLLQDFCNLLYTVQA